MARKENQAVKAAKRRAAWNEHYDDPFARRAARREIRAAELKERRENKAKESAEGKDSDKPGILSSIANWFGFGDDKGEEKAPPGSFKTSDGRTIKASTPKVSYETEEPPGSFKTTDGRTIKANRPQVSYEKGRSTTRSNKPSVTTSGRPITGEPASVSYETASKRSGTSNESSVGTTDGRTVKGFPASVSYETPSSRRGTSNAASVGTAGRKLEVPAATASYDSGKTEDDLFKDEMQVYSEKLRQLEALRKNPAGGDSAALEAEVATLKKKLDGEFRRRGLPSQT